MTEDDDQKGALRSYFDWCFQGSILTVALKFIWTGMWITALTTFQFIETGVIVVIGGLIWFVVNDYENWEIQWEDQNREQYQ